MARSAEARRPSGDARSGGTVFVAVVVVSISRGANSLSFFSGE